LTASTKTLMLVGLDGSGFINEAGRHDPEMIFGIGREWPIAKHTSLSGQIQFTWQKAILYNKKIQYGINWIGVENIECSFKCLDLPIQLKEGIPIWRHVGLQFHVGAMINFYTKDLSKRVSVSNAGSTDGSNHYDYMDSLAIDDVIQRSILNFEIGLSLNVAPYFLEFRYLRKHFDWISSLNVNCSMESIQVLVGVKL
jgi:hypothetical protein